MTVKRRWIDPRTGDYQLVGGSPRNDDTIASTVVLLLRTERGSCPVAPDHGSRLHTLRKATPEAGRLAREYVIEALAPVKQWLKDLDVKADAVSEATGARLEIVVAYRDTSGEARRVAFTRSL